MFFFSLDFDSVDKVILARPHTIGEYRVDVKKAVPKDQRQIQAHQQQLQQQQQQQQNYAIQMQAAATYHFYNHSPFHLVNHGSCAVPISSPPSLMTPNGDLTPFFRTSNNSNHHYHHHHHVPHSPRYQSPSNNRRQSSRGSQ
jgi:type II secretory pathway pseudopilin PulG